MDQPAVRARSLTVELGGKRILRELTFDARPGGSRACAGPAAAARPR